MSAAAHFDIDIKAALTVQLLEAFDKLTPAALTEQELGVIESEAGVYKLYLDDTLVYVGKTDGSLRKRLTYSPTLGDTPNLPDQPQHLLRPAAMIHPVPLWPQTKTHLF